jgi:ribosomal protein S18 acetylase RimI-like enzyme
MNREYRIKHYGKGDTRKNLIQYLDYEFFGKDLVWQDFENTHWFVLYLGGAPWTNPIGYAGVQLLDKKSAFLCRCGIKEEFRGQGLQLQLIRKRTNLLKSLNFKTAYTYTTIDNIWSMNNLISNKFKTCLFPESYFETELDVGDKVLYWKKEL